MKKNNKFAKILPFIIIIMIVLIVIFALISIGKALLSSTKKTNQPDYRSTAKAQLLTVDQNHAVAMTVRGKIVGQENFRSYKLVISPSKRKLITYKGYLGEVISSKELDNSPKAYEEFVYALDKANLVKGQPFAEADDDIRGICATGTVYEYDVLVNQESIDHLWTSTCKGSKGSLLASYQQLESLFMNQVPNAEKIISDSKKTK